MTCFKDYMLEIVSVKFSEINGAYKNQFKFKDTMLNASSKNFESIASKYSVVCTPKVLWGVKCRLETKVGQVVQVVLHLVLDQVLPVEG